MKEGTKEILLFIGIGIALFLVFGMKILDPRPTVIYPNAYCSGCGNDINAELTIDNGDYTIRVTDHCPDCN